MSDDIVTRLRAEAVTIVENHGFWLDVPNAFNNCADEIERLRDEIQRLTADRDRWRSLAERAMDLLDEANRVLAQIQDGLKND
jgi:hypothetical protein